MKSTRGNQEVWQCRVYRDKGRVACSAPQLRTTELDRIMADIFNQLAENKEAVIDAVVTVLQSVPDEHDYAQDIRRMEEDLSALRAKKDRLLELSIEGVISTAEFKQRNDGFNQQAQALEERLEALQAEAEKGRRTAEQLEEIRAALEKELSFQNGIHSALVTTILDKIVVKKHSTREKICLDIHLKFGGPWEAAFDRADPSLCFTRPRRSEAEGKIFRSGGQAVFWRQGKMVNIHDAFGLDFSKDDCLKVAFCTFENRAAVYEDFCTRFFPLYLAEGYSRDDFFTAQAFTNADTGIYGILICLDMEQEPSDWYQIILHEMSHLFCLTREIAGDNFTAKYIKTPLLEKIQKIAGCMLGMQYGASSLQIT